MWPFDKSDTIENLEELLKVDYNLRLEGIGTKPPAKPKGTEAKTRYAKAILPTAPYYKAVETAQAETVETIKVKYQEGTLDLEQVWSKREPHFVAVDWRQDPKEQKFKQTIKLPRAKYNTLEKMLLNVGLPMNLARKSAAWFNERMPKWKGKEGEKVPEKSADRGRQARS